MQGLIVENISNMYKVKAEDKIYESTARGKFKKEDITPVVGDMVELEIIDETNRKAVIKEIKNRTVYIKRPKLANITQIIFVISSKDPKPDLLMLDKQLAFSEFLGINAIIVLNKIDLDDEKQFEKIEKIYKKIGYKVIETEAKKQKGIEKLQEQLKNNISAFSGNSGVGKSTLINGIFKRDITQEGEISKRNRRGKNTTTAIKLYEINENTYIADTPGFSTFDISEIPSQELENYFVEFEREKEKCEFIGCTHIKEKKCGVKQAIEEGKISKERYNRFCKIYEELKEKHQIYVIAPLIEESENSDLTNVIELRDKMNLAFGSKYDIDIVHGKMTTAAKDLIMNEFKQNKIQILISTTVIEVGVDVPNASMIVIFDANRFGLSTLHQLRGRVGRGSIASKCILISNSDTKRLEIMEHTNDGFEISEEDFKLRGHGDLFGTKQSGDMTFKIASIKQDYKILMQAKKDSLEYLEDKNSNKEELKIALIDSINNNS